MSEEREPVPGALGLTTLGGGVAVERFAEELERVIGNIMDPNTDAKAKRSIQLKVTIKPTKDRDFGHLEVSCESKLAPVVSYGTRAYFGRHGQQLLAFEDDPRQVTLEDFIKSGEGVPSIPSATLEAGGEK